MRLMFFRFVVILLLLPLGLGAMNVRSLEVGYQHVSGLTYRGSVVFYLFSPSPVDSLVKLDWGDNSTGILINPVVTELPGDIKKVVYSATHTYSGPSTFTLSISYKVRGNNVQNVQFPLVEEIYAEAKLVVNPFVGGLNSPQFLEPPLQNICLGMSQTLSLAAVDLQGDSLTYALIPSRGADGNTVVGYYYPPATAAFSLDAHTGILTWNIPSAKGFWCFAYRIDKYRDGVWVGSVMRDMTINVINCSPFSANLSVPGDTCILAGNALGFIVNASYSGNDSITLSSFGEPYSLMDDPASFPQPVKGIGSVSSPFNWNISCSHVRPDAYQLIFRAILEDSLTTCNCTNTFNNQTIGSGYYSNVPVKFNNPCLPSWDGGYYLWFGADSAAPRFLYTPPLDLTAGNYMLSFDFIFSDHTGNPGTHCEGPDEPDEGMYLQYSTSGPSGPWVTMSYWDPSISDVEGGHVEDLIKWNNYSINVPDAAISTSSRFRWAQFESTGIYYDHWGLDNITVYKIADKLPAIEEISVEVIAPAPLNLMAYPASTSIDLEWNKSYCTNASGYHIYRKSAFYGYVPDACETGVPAYTGYQYIASTYSVDDTLFTDDNNGNGLPHGNDYCYMVTAWFENGAESQASNEACAQLPDDVPVITNVSVDITSATAGQFYIAWSRPDDLDQVSFPGPYRYNIYRAPSLSGGTAILVGSTNDLNDTTYTDSGVNTASSAYNYYIELQYTNGSTLVSLVSSYPASSVFLTAESWDESVLLNWEYNVPWSNDSFAIYRYNSVSGLFDLIAYTPETEYADTGLVNGQEYCYKIQSLGNYSLSGFVSPILNWSQEVCARPADLNPPCVPTLQISTDCNQVSNLLSWTNPLTVCGDDDVGSYQIYYSPTTDGLMSLISVISNPLDTFFLDQRENSVAGCYAVAATDTSGNQSALSNIVCIDIDLCDLYHLPNVFTPDGDGINDYFIPFPYDFVERIDMQIFNRWGSLVFATNDPDILWDGKNQQNSSECSEGVYFFVCLVYEQRLEGLRQRSLTGTVHLYRSKQ